MLIITDLAAFERALDSPLPPPIKRLLRNRADLIDLATFVIPACGNTLADIEAAAGIPLATNFIDGARYGEPGFTPAFEWALDHGGAFELPYVTSDDGSGVLLILPDCDSIDPVLLAMARAHAEKADPSGGGQDDTQHPAAP